MSRIVTLLLTAGVLALTGLAGADDPPAEKKDDEGHLRLKRKARPDKGKKDDKPAVREPGPEEPPADKDKGKPAKPRADEDVLEPEDARPPMPEKEDEQEILERLARNMRAVEEKLGNREVGDPTRQQQRDILRDIDALINKSEQQDNQGGGGGGADQQPPDAEDGDNNKQQNGGEKQQGGKQQGGKQQGGTKKQQGQGQKQQGQGQKRQPRQLRSERGQGGGQKMMASKNEGKGQGQQKPGEGAGGNNPSAGNGGPTSDKEREAADLKAKWGHLPETLRGEMDAFSNPQPFLPRYDRLIAEYYKNIARQGRKKGD